MQSQNDGRNDFDFLIGTWKVHHRTLKKRLNSSTDWVEFEGDTVDRKILNGLGNMDENILQTETGRIHAISLRLFDPRTQEWSIHWSTDRTGTLDVPVVGSFQDGRGEFFWQEVFEGPTRLRSLHLVEDRSRFLSVGAGVFRRRRQNMGDELDHGIHTSMNDYTYSPILELRMYALHPGRRDELIKLFEREFIESQESVGIQVIGQFHDLDDPDQFVWLRGFNDMSARAQSLPAFYDGPVWKAHRDAANATMIDSDNVLLLRLPPGNRGFSFGNGNRPPVGSRRRQDGFIAATIYYFEAPVNSSFIRYFEDTIKSVLSEADAEVLAYFVTEDGPNNFPRLPVREGENTFVWFSGFHDQEAYQRHLAKCRESKRWKDEISKYLSRQLKGKPEVLRLTPTPRSWLTGNT